MPNSTAHLDAERCKGCGLCVAYCPKHLVALGRQLNAKGYCAAEINDKDKCTLCGFCAMMCPDLAIEIRSN